MSQPSSTSFASGSQSGIWTSSSATMHSMSGGVVMPAVSNRGANSNHASYAPPATVGVPQLSVTGSASFQRIHADVANANTIKEEVSAQPMRVGRPGTGSVGELTPIGDGILPLLACALAYFLVRAHRAKKFQGIKIQGFKGMKHTIFSNGIKALFCIIALFCSAQAFSQARPNAALWQGDTITVSYTTGGRTYYIAHVPGNGNGVTAVQDTPNENCLWVLSSMKGEPTAANGKENGAVVQAMSLSAHNAGEKEKYLYMGASNYGSLYLVDGSAYSQQSNFYTIKKSQVANEYIEANILVKSGRTNYYINYNYYFYAANTTRPQTYRIQRWSGVTESTVRPTFMPNSVIFDWAENTTAADAQAIDVTCKVTKREGKYYYNRSNPEQRIILQNPTETEADAGSVSFAWQNAPESQMTFTEPSYDSETKTYSFQVKPVGASPVVTSGTLEDIFNHIVCTATYNGKPSTGEMSCMRRKYLYRTLQPLDFTVTHPTYTFAMSGSDLTLEPFLYVQEGEEWVNTDGFVEKSIVSPMYYYDRNDDGTITSALKHADRYRVVYGDASVSVPNSDPLRNALQVSVSSSLPTWLRFTGYTKWGINFTAAANAGEEARSAVVMISVDYEHAVLDAYGNDTGKRIQGTFIRQVILRQPGTNAGAAIAFHHKGETIEVGKQGAGQQKVHTNKQIRYYIPGGSDVVELRPAETSFFAYRRWYNYDNGLGIQNSAEANNNTTWASAPSISVTSSRTTTAYNYTPINTTSTHSRGVFAIAREGSTSSGFRLLYNEQNEVMPTIRPYANASGGPHNNGVHTIACDLSCYTDYAITETSGNLTSVTEPTLSYRMLFELHPATEVADALAALPAGKYLEEYEYTAPTGVDVHLTTAQRFRSYRYHISEIGYFYYNNSTLTRLQGGVNGQTITWKRDGSTFTPTYSTNTDNAIVNSRTTGDVVYTLEIGGKRIAKFTVHYMAPTEVGPSSVALLTNKEISDRYQVLRKIDWDDVDTKSGSDNVIANYHLPWEDATFGFAYRHGTQNTATNRPSNQDLCYYGEYLLVNRWNKTGTYGWMDPKIENHTGKANGYMLFADGTMEPSMVACINTSTQICSGQMMYCSAWVANACPSGYGTGANPIFRFNVQGRNADNEEWQDVEIFFAGELPKGSGWQQIKFPVSSHNSYSQTRVCVYNFATTNSGNDFYLDDIYLFATPLPISAYQGESACSGEDVVVIVKVDYQNVVDDLQDRDIYYQGWVEIKNPSAGTPGQPDSVTVAIPDLADFGGYYMWHNDHGAGECSYSIKSKDEYDHPEKISAGTSVQDIGKIHIPAKNFTPADADIYTSVQAFIEHLHSLAGRAARAGVFYILQQDGTYSMYLAHLFQARDGGNYEVRFAEDADELTSPLCAMSVKFPIYKQTQLTFGDNSEPISTPLLDVCPNVNDEIKVTVSNAHIASSANSVQTTLGRADWLVGIAADSIYGKAYVDYPVGYNYETKLPAAPSGKVYVKEHSTIAAEKAKADAAFSTFYGYTREEVTTAFTYDLRRLPYVNNPNVNYDVTDYTKLDKNGFLNERNYTIVYDLCRRGLVEMNVGKRTVMLNPGDSLFLWVFPIVGSAELNGQTLDVCNEPQWVDFRTSKLSGESTEQIFNPSPVANKDKNPAQKLTVPTVRVAASQANVSFQVPVTDLNNVVLGWDSLRVIGTNDQTVYGSKTLKQWVEEYNTAYNDWANDNAKPKTHSYPAPATFSMRYYADKVYQGTNGEKYYLSDGITPNPNYHSNTKCSSVGSHAWFYYETPAQIVERNHQDAPHATSVITFRPIDAAYVAYLQDRREKSNVFVDEVQQASVYSASDANWVRKTDTEGTLPQPGWQYENKVNGTLTPEMHANYTYNMTTKLITNTFAGETSGSQDASGCNYATTYFDVIVVPELVIWRPTVSNEWGNDANWHGIVNGVEMDWGFTPLPETSVIIPELDNELLYPEVTGTNLYPMSAGYAPAACDNIYMEAGAHIIGLEKLQYNKAYVDMPVVHAQWQAMASPMRKMYSGDFFMPHNATDWSGATLENAPYSTDTYGAVNDLLGTHTGEAATNGSLFDPAPFSGTRVSSNPYAFWVEYYNREVKTYHNSTEESETTTHTATAAFVGSNALDEVILPGQGIQVLGYGPWEENDSHNIALRLPKQDESYKYFLYGEQTTYGVTTTRDEANRKFAWTSDGVAGDDLEKMTIRLTNGTSGKTFFLGNPTMAYVDLVEFMSDNKGVLTGSFQYMNNGAWVAVSGSILDISGHRFLAPMEAILVEAKVASTTLDVVFKASQLTLDNMSFHANAPARLPDPDPAPGAPARQSLQEQPQEPVQLMTITAFNDYMEAVTYLGKQSGTRNGFRQGEDAFAVSSGIESLVNSDFITPLSIYTVTDSTALMVDLRPGISLVPLRFMTHSDYATDSVQIIFNVTSNWTTPCYLVDTIAGTHELILNGYLMTIALPENHQSRYFIQGPDTYVPDAPVDPGVATGTELIQDNSLNAEHLADFPFEKVLHNGHIYLRRGTTLFNVTGQLVK